MSSEYPFCKDCASLVGVRSHIERAEEWKCGESPFSLDPVHGSRIYTQTCREARKDSGVCTLAGKLFKAYEPPAPRLPAGKAAVPSADDLLGELGQ